MKNYKALIEKTLKDNSLTIYAIEGVGMDYKTIYIGRDGKVIREVNDMNYKGCYFQILRLLEKKKMEARNGNKL